MQSKHYNFTSNSIKFRNFSLSRKKLVFPGSSLKGILREGPCGYPNNSIKRFLNYRITLCKNNHTYHNFSQDYKSSLYFLLERQKSKIKLLNTVYFSNETFVSFPPKSTLGLQFRIFAFYIPHKFQSDFLVTNFHSIKTIKKALSSLYSIQSAFYARGYAPGIEGTYASPSFARGGKLLWGRLIYYYHPLISLRKDVNVRGFPLDIQKTNFPVPVNQLHFGRKFIRLSGFSQPFNFEKYKDLSSDNLFFNANYKKDSKHVFTKILLFLKKETLNKSYQTPAVIITKVNQQLRKIYYFTVPSIKALMRSDPDGLGVKQITAAYTIKDCIAPCFLLLGCASERITSPPLHDLTGAQLNHNIPPKGGDRGILFKGQSPLNRGGIIAFFSSPPLRGGYDARGYAPGIEGTLTPRAYGDLSISKAHFLTLIDKSLKKLIWTMLKKQNSNISNYFIANKNWFFLVVKSLIKTYLFNRQESNPLKDQKSNSFPQMSYFFSLSLIPFSSLFLKKENSCLIQHKYFYLWPKKCRKNIEPYLGGDKGRMKRRHKGDTLLNDLCFANQSAFIEGTYASPSRSGIPPFHYSFHGTHGKNLHPPLWGDKGGMLCIPYDNSREKNKNESRNYLFGITHYLDSSKRKQSVLKMSTLFQKFSIISEILVISKFYSLGGILFLVPAKRNILNLLEISGTQLISRRFKGLKMGKILNQKENYNISTDKFQNVLILYKKSCNKLKNSKKQKLLSIWKNQNQVTSFCYYYF
jgi:hypothetical protein